MYVTPFIIMFVLFISVAKIFWTSFNIWLSSALDLEVLELTPKETVVGFFSDERSMQKIVLFLFLVARNYINCCKWTDTKVRWNYRNYTMHWFLFPF
jgi:hypothetical protein